MLVLVDNLPYVRVVFHLVSLAKNLLGSQVISPMHNLVLHRVTSLQITRQADHRVNLLVSLQDILVLVHLVNQVGSHQISRPRSRQVNRL